MCTAKSSMEYADVQLNSVANVKPHCAYLFEIASKNFINKVSGKKEANGCKTSLFLSKARSSRRQLEFSFNTAIAECGYHNLDNV